MAKKQEKLDFEHTLESLESLVERMESGELSLEDSLNSYEKGVLLARECQKALKTAELRIKTLSDKLEEPSDDTDESA